MADRYTQVTTTSWGKRIGGSFKGILFGVFLVVAAFGLLFWNEGRAVKTRKTLEEGASQVVSVSPDPVNPGFDGKLIHLSGPTSTPETLTDADFGIALNAIKLERSVQMYQWQERKDTETRKKTGGSTETVTTYTYEKGWSDRLVSSSGFEHPEGHENPAQMPYESRQVAAQTVLLGGFQLSPGLIGKMTQDQAHALSGLSDLPPEMRWKAKIDDGAVYLGRDPKSPAVGDVRVSFRTVAPDTVSVVARQNGSRLEPYQTKAGGTVELLSYGSIPADQMFQAAQRANTVMTWILRFVGALMMIFGLSTVLRPLSVFADVLPALGNLVAKGTGLLAFVTGLSLSLVTIAVAWFFYRPWIAIPLLALALVIVVVGVRAVRKRSGKGAAPAPAVPPPPPPPPPA